MPQPSGTRSLRGTPSMAKTRSTFVCQSCGATYMRWVGRCTDCGQWNTVLEETVVESGKHARTSIGESHAGFDPCACSQIPDRHPSFLAKRGRPFSFKRGDRLIAGSHRKTGNPFPATFSPVFLTSWIPQINGSRHPGGLFHGLWNGQWFQGFRSSTFLLV